MSKISVNEMVPRLRASLERLLVSKLAPQCCWEQGPTIRVPREIESYWTWRQSASNWRSYNFHNLSKVQTLRFVELCTEYGYEEGQKVVANHITPLSQWQGDDQAEMRDMIEIVAS
jgi:hypothetical protein